MTGQSRPLRSTPPRKTHQTPRHPADHMTHILTTPLTGPAAWRGEAIRTPSLWTLHFSASDISELERALGHARHTGRSINELRPEDFPLNGLLPTLRSVADELENGKGFQVLRGLDISRYNQTDLHTLYYGLGLHLGTPVCQNPRGDLLGLVAHVGDVADKNTRVYETNLYLPYHCDPSDVVGLLCVRKAKSGGVSSLISVAAMYNEILAHHKEYLALYYRTWYFAHLCEPLPSLSPIFSMNEGKLSCRYLRQYIELGHEIRQLPLSRVELEALDIFDSLMTRDDLRLDMMLEPGDIQFANNYAVLHSRTAFVDHADAAQRRELQRLWLKMPNARTLAPEFPGRNGFPRPQTSAV